MIRCIAIDDEPLALAQISSYINKVPYLELVGRCRDAAEALKVLRGVDDIAFCELTALDVVRHPLVQKIVRAYEVYESARRPNREERRAAAFRKK